MTLQTMTVGEEMNNLTAAQIELLVVLAEECSEVGKEVCKILRHGPDSYHPETKITNQENLETELGDVLCVIGLLANAGQINYDHVTRHAIVKLDRISKYLHHNVITTVRKQ